MFNSFSNFFSCTSRKWIMDMDLKFKKIFEGDTVKLELSSMLEEIKEAIWSWDTNWDITALTLRGSLRSRGGTSNTAVCRSSSWSTCRAATGG
ncbi:hypothetical protein J1N35_039417 [Gossypium stocksii]|uniref:Uncharacterized protein n=1 Tax=Gossypium stocksii TaxID=47602 RepID=A0A9D3ZNK7_9ROSI|nr:hypothetical protein J1N35_039417 [Gossypium stocksii]